jgi:hypothetical protein
VAWTGFSGVVDIYRNSTRIATATTNDGTFAESVRGSGTMTYKVCETGSTTDCAQGSIVI